MKQILVCIGLMVGMAFQTQQQQVPPKKYSVALTLPEWERYIQYQDYVKSQLRQSDIPSKQVAFIQDSLINPFQGELIKQLNAQITAEKSKDTSKPKKP